MRLAGKLVLFFLLGTAFFQNTTAQTVGYSFASSSATYTPITGGTQLSSGSLVDDATFSQTLPFTFTFNGTAFTQIYACENGYISFGSTDPGTSTRSAISSTSSGFMLASPLSGDLQGIDATSELRVQVLGTAPNRTYVVQWTNLQQYLGSGQSYNYQVRLEEANGVALNQVVRFVYGTVSSTFATNTYQVGLRGLNNASYVNRSTFTNWSSTTSGTTNTDACSVSSTVSPASGLTFTWTPLPQTYTSSTTTQNTSFIAPSSTAQQIIGIQIVTSGGSVNPLSLTTLNLSTLGSTNVADIVNAKVYYSGTTATFSTTTQYGSTVNAPLGSFTVSGTQALATGTNYFWLAYDVSPSASNGNVLDAQCTQITLSGTNYIPTVTSPAGSRLISFPFAGNYNIGTGQTYTTLTAAVSAINAVGMSAPVTFTLIDSTYSTNETFPIVINQISGSSPTNTLTIKPSTSNYPIITGSASSLITLNGADNIVIDGSAYNNNSRELTFINNSTSTSAVIFISSLGTGAGARNVTVQNCNIQGGASTSTGVVGIFAGGTTISTAGSGADNDKLSIINNGITKAYYGIYCRGLASTGMLDTLVIANNSIGSNTSNAVVLYSGIDVQNATLSNIYNNTIFNMTQTGGFSASLVAIALGGTLVTSNVYNNIIDGVLNPSSGGWGAYGINVSGTITSANIYNNVISNISTMNYSTSSTTFNAFGIRITVAGTFSIYNNSINLYGTVPNIGTTAHFSACLLAIAGTSIDLRNNVFVNSQTGLTGSKSYAIYSTVASSVFATTTNNNDYFVSGANGVLGFITSADQTTLATWKTAMGAPRDASSINIDPLFNTNSILRPTVASPLLNAAAPISTVTTDLRGITRSLTTPSIGAYEVGGEFIPPAISFTPIANTSSTSNLALNGFATITDNSGINVTAGTKPRIYFKKASNANAFGGNTSADNGWKWVEASNATSPFDFTINYALLTGGGVTIGDQIQYFVVAQDLAATPNATVANYSFIRTVAGSVGLTSANFPLYGFNNFNIQSSLPTTFLNVTATQKNVGIEVTWNTANEVNMDSYEIEESSDGINFIKSTSVVAKNATTNNYRWFDATVIYGDNFYRIKSVEKSGTAKYSNVVRVNMGGKNVEFTVYPNPVKGGVVSLQMSNVEKGIYTVKIYNNAGQEISNKTITSSGGTSTETITLGKGTAKGNYQMLIINGTTSVTKSVVVE